MDTREKIKTFEELRPLLANQSWTILAGAFDPLTPSLAARIQSWASPGRRLLIVVQAGSDELLDTSSRALLMAALRAVDAVVIETSDEWRAWAAHHPALRVVDDREACLRDRRDFEERVIGSYSASPDRSCN